MNDLFGFTRTVIKTRHALITSDGHVPSALPGWTNAHCVILISPAMGARFSQYLITLDKKGEGAGRTGERELFAYVLEGSCAAQIDGRKLKLRAGSYVYVPPGSEYRFNTAAKAVKLLLFEKEFQALPGASGPEFFAGHESEVEGQPFLGNKDARLQVLLPDNPRFDMAVNIFTYQPGATLPFVETHIMEHGLLMLRGQGVYRLESDWYPVRAGDVIWMAPYCPQWFVAMGKTTASYIYYKDVNRPPI